MPRPAAIARLAILAAAAAAASGPSRAEELLSHRAVYQMSLDAGDRSSDVVGASGVMSYKFQRACDGWLTENKTVLTLLYDNGVDAKTDWSFASWESFDGRQFRFRARYLADGKVTESLSGSATLTGSGGVAQFAEPSEETIDLPTGTLLPTEHLRLILDAAAAGRRSMSRTVFDGASTDNPYVVNVLMGAAKAPEKPGPASALPASRLFWTRAAFFPYRAEDLLPEFEMAARYRADGVATHITQVFERFSIDVRLKEIEILPAPDC